MFVLLPFIIWMFDTSVSSESRSHASGRLQQRPGASGWFSSWWRWR
jgi:hypothetical protein